MSTINTSKKYRKALGFSSKNKIKKYFKATDIVKVNWSLIDDYNARLIELFSKINEVIFEEYKMSAENFSDFSSQVMEAYNAFLLPYDKKCEVFQSNENLQYIGFAKSTWKDNSERYEFVHAFLIDLKHVVKTWNRFNHKEDVENLISAINEQSDRINQLLTEGV